MSGRRPSARRHARRGAAVLAALLIVTLAVTTVSALMWATHLRLRTLENQRLRDQALALQNGGFDWARLILRDDLQRTQGIDHRGEVWAVPIAQTRLSDLIRAQDIAGRADSLDSETYFSGRIVDAQAQFNLTSLVRMTVGADGSRVATDIDADARDALARLLDLAGLDPGLAPLTAAYVLASYAPPEADAPRPLSALADLVRVSPAFGTTAIARLAPFVTVLPRPTRVNANTAPAEVLAAVAGLPMPLAAQLAADRDRAFFVSTANVQERIQALSGRNGVGAGAGAGAGAPRAGLDVGSQYFSVIMHLRHGRAEIARQALIERRSGTGGTITRLIEIRDAADDALNYVNS